jgi:glycosyltransferase involved in cell wall biosynthesis
MVTLAIPTFNRLELLKRAVASALTQSYKNLEIIISDNASTDGTPEYLGLLDDVRIKVFLGEKNLGMVANWDHCLANACGDYFLLMSDDDALFEESAIEKLVSGFLGESGKNVGVVFSDVMLERVKKNVLKRTFYKNTQCKTAEIVTDFFMNKVSIYPCATLLRTKDIRDFGGYSSFGATLAVDACVWVSLALKYGQVRRMDEPLALYRIHQSLSSSSIDLWTRDLDIMQSLFAKYREKFSLNEYRKISGAIHSASNRIALGYIVRKFREDPEYKLMNLLNDTIKFQKRILTFGNAKFIINKVFDNFKTMEN